MPKFVVRVPVIYYEFYEIEAENENAARELVSDGDGDELEDWREYVDILDSVEPEEWEVQPK